MKKLWSKVIHYLTKEKKKFAKGICFDKLFMIFIIGSIFGAYYEQIFTLVTKYLETGSIVWELRRGVIYGPFNVIYGFGAVIIVSLLADKNHKWYQTFLYGAFLGGGFEYIMSFLQETFTHTISWDYSDHLLNFQGRTSVPFMIGWGFFTFAFVHWLYPLISKWIEKIPYNLGKIMTKVLLIFMAFNMAISWTAIIRQTLRRNNIPAFTPVGRFYDKYYNDEFLSKYFPNMSAKERN